MHLPSNATGSDQGKQERAYRPETSIRVATSTSKAGSAEKASLGKIARECKEILVWHGYERRNSNGTPEKRKGRPVETDAE
jgi:hypothetical protein